MADVEIRPVRAEDLEGVYAVFAACQRAFLPEPEFTLEHMENMWQLERRRWVAVDAGEIVGYAELSGDVVVLVHPARRRRGIGRRLLETAEERAEGEKLLAFGEALEPAAAPFLRQAGFEKTSEVWKMSVALEAEPPAPAWPAGVGVRTFAEDDARPLKALLDLAYAEEPDPPRPFEDWRQLMLGDPSFDASVWFLAETDGELVGAALNWADGFVKDLVVHPAWRRRGLGAALLLHTFSTFYRRGIRTVTLKTDSLNPTAAWRLYEHLGMRKVRTLEVFEKRL